MILGLVLSLGLTWLRICRTIIQNTSQFAAPCFRQGQGDVQKASCLAQSPFPSADGRAKTVETTLLLAVFTDCKRDNQQPRHD